jgi:uncharacterized protein YlbG (UPF0298 family)
METEKMKKYRVIIGNLLWTRKRILRYGMLALLVVVLYINRHNLLGIYESIMENIGYLKSVHEVKSSKIEELEKRIVQLEEVKEQDIIFRTMGWFMCYGCGVVCGMIVAEMFMK